MTATHPTFGGAAPSFILAKPLPKTAVFWRDLVRGEKVLLLQQYPNLKTYEVYQSPYFKVRAGDFTNRLAAFKLYSDLKPMFKRCIIVPDRVLSDL